MSNGLMSVLLTPLASFAIAAASVPLVKRLAVRVGAMAAPAPDCRHQNPTPLLGGLAIVGAMLLALAVTGNLPAWMLWSTTALLVTGLVDDLIVLTPMQKLAAEIAVAVALVTAGPALKVAPWPILNAGIVIFWLLATSNSFNLIDGLDGLASAIGVVASLAIAAVALLHNQVALGCWALALSGALAAFLVYNFHPASIFMGDGGALPVGLLLGVLSLKAGAVAQSSRLTVYVFAILVMLVPLLDTAIVSVTRLATGRSISRRGLDHSHHRLLALGLSDQRVVAVSSGIAALAASAAVCAGILPHAYVLAALPFLILAAALIGLFMIDLSFESRAPGVAYGYLPSFARLILKATYQWRLVDVVLDAAVITAAYSGAFLIRLNFSLSDGLAASIAWSLPWVLASAYPALVLAGTYRGIWRYVGIADAVRLANAALMAGLLLLAMSYLRTLPISGSIVALFAILLFNLLVASRMSFQLLRKGIAQMAEPRERVLIVGAGQTGLAAARQLASTGDRNRRLVGFIDDDGFKLGKLVDGEPVLGSIDDLDRIYETSPFDQILIAEAALAEERLRSVSTFAARHRLAVRKFSIQLDEMRVDNGRVSPLGFPLPARRTLPAGS